MKRTLKILAVFMLAIFCGIALVGCGVINVSGKTFKFESVEVDWGRAKDEQKQELFEEYLVSNVTELLNALKTRKNRNSRITTFGTDGKYTTVDTDGKILDSGYYKQDDDVITLCETEDFSQPGNYTLKANDKGYIVSVKLNDEFGIFARYQYALDK